MLSPKQKLFVQEYLKDKNGARAARAAGYSKKTAREQATRLLSKVYVAKAVETGLARQIERAQLTGDMVIAELRKHAFAKLKDAYAKNGKLLSPHDMPEDVQAALHGLETDEIFADRFKIGETKKVKLSDKIKALELLGKHFKIFTDVSESSNTNLNVNSVPLTPEEAKATYQKIKSDC